MISLTIKKELSIRGIIKKNRKNNLTTLAEAIILQSVEDLFNKRYIEECKAFFYGEGFNICAEIAEMKIVEQIKLITMVRKYLDKRNNSIRRLLKGNFS